MEKDTDELTLLGLKLKLARKEGVSFLQVSDHLQVPMYQFNDLLLYDVDLTKMSMSINKVAEDFVSDIISEIENVC